MNEILTINKNEQFDIKNVRQYFAFEKHNIFHNFRSFILIQRFYNENKKKIKYFKIIINILLTFLINDSQQKSFRKQNRFIKQ